MPNWVYGLLFLIGYIIFLIAAGCFGVWKARQDFRRDYGEEVYQRAMKKRGVKP